MANYEPHTQPEHADLPKREWQCPDYGTMNWWEDAECQYCERFDQEPPAVPCVDDTESHE